MIALLLLQLSFNPECLPPNVAPQTIERIIQVESGGNPLAIGVNSKERVAIPQPKNIDDAARIANALIEAGYSVDMGLMQINSSNLASLGLTVREVFDPCVNIHAGATILSRNYKVAAARYGSGQRALLAALSAYNTGDFKAGFQNGYVSRFFSGNAIQKENIEGKGFTQDPYTAETKIDLSH